MVEIVVEEDFQITFPKSDFKCLEMFWGFKKTLPLLSIHSHAATVK